MLQNDFRLRPSRCYQRLLIIVFVMGCMIISALHQHFLVTVLLLILLMSYLMLVFWAHGLLKHTESVTGLRHLSGRDWMLQTGRHSAFATLRGDSVVTPYVCVLRFQEQEQGRRTARQFMVFFDSLNEDDFRALIVRLRSD